VAGGFSTFFIAAALQPANFGIWLTMTLFVSYSSILSLGTVETLLKQFPFYKGKGDLKAASRLEDVVFTAIVITATVILVVGFILPIFLTRLQTNSIMPAIRMMVVAAGLSFPSAFFYYRFVAHQNFKTMGLLESMRALLNIFLVVGFSYSWGLTGAAVGFCLTEMIVCGVSSILSSRSYGRVKLLFDFRAIWNSILIGLPITIFWWISMLQGSVDRLVSISLLGKVPTGYYGIGISIVSVILLLPQSISRVLYPRINEKLGETSREEDLFRIVVFPTRVLGLAIAGVIGVTVIFMPFVYHLIPKYLPGLAATQILLVLSFFRFSTANGVNFLIATNRQNWLCLLVLASTCIAVIASYGAVRLGFGIEGLAVSTCFSGLFLTLFVWRSVFAGMGFAFSKQLEEIMKLHVPFMLLLILLGFGILVSPQFLLQTTMFGIVYAVIFTLIYSCILFALPLTRQWINEIFIMFRRAFISTVSS
jgi:O-antigen/teichoic acid export membrane protein